jgi:hypothetical protein
MTFLIHCWIWLVSILLRIFARVFIRVKLQIAKQFRAKKNNILSITPPDFKLYYRAIVMKSMVFAQNSQVDPCRRVEDPEIRPGAST